MHRLKINKEYFFIPADEHSHHSMWIKNKMKAGDKIPTKINRTFFPILLCKRNAFGFTYPQTNPKNNEFVHLTVSYSTFLWIKLWLNKKKSLITLLSFHNEKLFFMLIINKLKEISHNFYTILLITLKIPDIF